MTFGSGFTPFARVSSMAGALRNRQAQKNSEKAQQQLPRIRVGVCAMDKKAQSKPMQAILKRMNLADEFDLVIFGDEVILNKPITEWPLCQVLLTWHSTGFPLQKAQDYVKLRNPILINDVHQQTSLLDRREVYIRLAEHSVPTPQHIVVNRTEAQAAAGEDPEGFEETTDYVCMGDVKLSKPFVEKPAAADNHNVWIYYPHSMGGGVKMMFRKVGNKSADYDSKHPGTVRRDGSYIYEEFIATSGTDIKVYTVGSEYAHAEARKSPVVDGKVQRTVDGKEIRFPVLLTPQEKEVASIVVQAFRQKVCGFDLLRTDSGQSYVCDVNGWSFVKNSQKYYEDAARILRHMIFQAQSPNTLSMRRPLPQLTLDEELPDCLLPDLEATPQEELEKAEMIHVRQLQAEIEHTNKVSVDRELLCVLAVIRHGDRTPKHKLKLTVTNQPFLDVFAKYKDSKGRQAKLKAPAELEAFLQAVLQVLPPHFAVGNPPETPPEGGAVMGLPSVSGPPKESPSGPTAPAKPPQPPPAQPVSTGAAIDAPTQPRTTTTSAEQPIITNSTPAPSAMATGTLAAADSIPVTPRDRGPASTDNPPFPISQSTDGGEGGVHGGASRGASARVDADNEEIDEAESETAQLAIILRVLRAGNHFSGINRKVQLKPVGHADDGSVNKIQVIVKWGGVLTHLGRRQAEELGNIYRMVMYPNSSDGGLLRLHSTYRHDLKIYSSDEGRVQTSAAAFAKGLLDLEGDSLTPVLVSLVKKDAAMLDAFGKGASEDIQRTKDQLYCTLTRDPATGEAHCKGADKSQRSLPVSPNRSTTSQVDNVSVNGADDVTSMAVPHAPDQPLAKLRALYHAIKELLLQLRKHVWHASAFSTERQFSVLNTSDYTQEDLSAPYGTESMLMMWDRWKKLEKAFYNPDADQFDISKIPDIYDSIKFDCIHNSHLRCDYSKVFPIAKELADCVIPAEYGINPVHKLRIAKKIAAELIGKLLVDLDNSRADCEATAFDATGGEHPFATHEHPKLVGAEPPAVARSVLGDSNCECDPDASSGDEEEEEQEDSRVHVLAPFTQNVNSIKRHVRTRIYFTSESHIHSLMSILRHTDFDGRSLLSGEALEKLDKSVEFDYLTQIVFRLYEPKDEASRFQVEIQFSNGANYDPRVTKVMNDKPRENVHRGSSVPLTEFTEHMSTWGSTRKVPCAPGSVFSSTVGGNASSQSHLPAAAAPSAPGAADGTATAAAAAAAAAAARVPLQAQAAISSWAPSTSDAGTSEALL